MDLSDYVGVEWREPSALDPGFTCRHLAAKAWKELCDVYFPTFDVTLRTADREEIDRLINDTMEASWLRITAGEERRFDCVVIREGRYDHHIGIVERPGYMLHLSRGGTSTIERYATMGFSRRITGFYRHRSLSSERAR